MSDVKKEKKERTPKQLAHTQKLILLNKERAELRKKQKADGTYVAPPKKEKKIKKQKAETLIIKEVENEEEPSKISAPVKIKEPKPLYKQVIKKKNKKKPKPPPEPIYDSDASTDLEADISDYASDESATHALAGHHGVEEEYYEVQEEEEPEPEPEPNYTPEPEPEQVIKPVKRRRTYHR